MTVSRLLAASRDRVIASTSSLFSHGPAPLANTLDHLGDPGLLGPDSVSWPVIGDATAFVGGVRALLIQAAHPEVAAGVADHSRYRADPLGRLSRTSFYVTATTYGAMPEVEHAVTGVRRAHRVIRGTSERGRTYDATAPELASWVHNALTDSFLEAYRAYGPRRLGAADADRFVEEQTRIGHLLIDGALPATSSALRTAITDNADLANSVATAEAVRFLRRPPLPGAVQIGYQLVLAAALAITPPNITETLGLQSPAGARAVGRVTVDGLRWALGSSPSWHIALVRAGAPIPPRTFRQPLPDEAEAVLQAA